MSTLFDIWHIMQTELFPWLEEEFDPLSDKEREFVQIVSLLDLPSHMREYRWRGFGRKKKSRLNMAKAFVAKSVYKFNTTDLLIEYLKKCKTVRRLCGWELHREVPSSATFSRAFAEFAIHNLPQTIHEAMVRKGKRPRKGEELPPRPPKRGELQETWEIIYRTCRITVTLERKKTARATRRRGSAINSILIASTVISRSAPFFHRPPCMIYRWRFLLPR